ncbi:MAG: hypothetical protein WAU75_18555 [Solirubrobacteraceae bacterium]
MRRIGPAVMACALVALSATALAASGRQHHVTDHLIGAQFQKQGKTSTYAFEVHASDAGTGAAYTVDTSTSSTGGTTHGVAYFASGSVRTAGTYRIGAARSNGVISVTFTGRDTGGTGAFKGIHGTYRGTGTDNTKTNVATLTLKGTDTY